MDVIEPNQNDGRAEEEKEESRWERDKVCDVEWSDAQDLRHTVALPCHRGKGAVARAGRELSYPLRKFRSTAFVSEISDAKQKAFPSKSQSKMTHQAHSLTVLNTYTVCMVSRRVRKVATVSMDRFEVVCSCLW